jgi:solute:Na+ symporter, SSS family
LNQFYFWPIITYIVILILISFWSNSKIHNAEDYLVGGRRFNLLLSTFALFATWFGAGTVLTSSEEISHEGIRAAALEPLGAGFCLILAGFFIAKPLWNMKLLTMSDFYRDKFGKKTERFTVVFNIPIFVGWLAVQFISLAEIFNTLFGFNILLMIFIIAILAVVLTVSGGLWSVSITDSVQLTFVILGLILIAYKVLSFHGLAPADQFQVYWDNTQDWKKVLIPQDKLMHTFKWFGIFTLSALGNMTGQDLGQRIFSAKSAKVAQLGCIIAGASYIVIGMIPAMAGVFKHVLLGDDYQGVLMIGIAQKYLTPAFGVLFVIAIMSAVISTITSALLAPASIMANNLLKAYFPKHSVLFLSRISVIIVAITAVLVSILGENVYGILEASYAIGFVSLFCPLFVGIFHKKTSERAILYAMFVGLGVWLLGFVIRGNFPFELMAAALSFVTYYAISGIYKDSVIR